MRQDFTAKEKPKFRALWSVDSFDVSHLSYLTDEEIDDLFAKQRKAYYSGKSGLYYPSGLQPVKHVRKNMIVKGFYENVLRIIGNATNELSFNGDDTKARYIAVGVNTDPTNINMTQLEKEIARLPISERYFSNTTLELAVFFNRNQGNGVQTTFVQNIIQTPGEQVFEVDDTTGFDIGDRIRVTGGVQFDFRTITGINLMANTITVQPELTVDPDPGDQVIQCWAEAATFAGTDATSAPNSGTMFNRLAPQNSQLDYAKDNTKIATVRIRFIGDV